MCLYIRVCMCVFGSGVYTHTHEGGEKWERNMQRKREEALFVEDDDEAERELWVGWIIK